ncbi:MAG: YfiT family bacillithiol transferase [bacterium]
MEAPQYPVGPAQARDQYDAQERDELIAQIEQAPDLMRKALLGLNEEQLNTKYKKWTVKQIVNHLADSHVNSYVRFRWTLTEEAPAIKAYDDGLWSELPDAKDGDLEPSLKLLEGIHQRWARLLRSMTDAQYARAFVHPDGRSISLFRALDIYAWHGRHHTGQILWMRDQKGWGSGAQ